jgi:intein/homing endonuclease
LINYVKPLFENLFNVKMSVYFQKQKNVMYLSKGNRDVIFTLNKFGLKSGNKKKNNQGIPSWIFKSKKYLECCIRGLLDTDGCLCPITGRDYYYIWFSSNIEQLRKDFTQAMKKLGFKTSKWNLRKNRTPDTYVGKKDLINKYFETISFKNQRHLNKLCAPIVQRPNRVME